MALEHGDKHVDDVHLYAKFHAHCACMAALTGENELLCWKLFMDSISLPCKR
jgi:hypothetical protein